jgi:hypothetical protein
MEEDEFHATHLEPPTQATTPQQEQWGVRHLYTSESVPNCKSRRQHREGRTFQESPEICAAILSKVKTSLQH